AKNSSLSPTVVAARFVPLLTPKEVTCDYAANPTNAHAERRLADNNKREEPVTATTAACGIRKVRPDPRHCHVISNLLMHHRSEQIQEVTRRHQLSGVIIEPRPQRKHEMHPAKNRE